MSEKYGIRDPSISAIYRGTGVRCFDVDRELVKEKTNEPAARFEFKHGYTSVIDFSIPEMQFHINCCNRMQIPFFVIINYHFDENNQLIHSQDYPNLKETDQIKKMIVHAQYTIIPGNQIAIKLMRCDKDNLTEISFWRFQYDLIGRIFYPHAREWIGMGNTWIEPKKEILIKNSVSLSITL